MNRRCGVVRIPKVDAIQRAPPSVEVKYHWIDTCIEGSVVDRINAAAGSKTVFSVEPSETERTNDVSGQIRNVIPTLISYSILSYHPGEVDAGRTVLLATSN